MMPRNRKDLILSHGVDRNNNYMKVRDPESGVRKRKIEELELKRELKAESKEVWE